MHADARMSIRLPGEYLAFAQNYAREREMTLTELVVGYLKRLRDSAVVSEEITPEVRRMIGIVPSDGDGNGRDEYLDYIERKHS